MSAWAEDRAMLGSNPSADPGTKTEAGCYTRHPVSLVVASLGIGTKAINPGGLGAGPQMPILQPNCDRTLRAWLKNVGSYPGI
jgi:hypothetical protein